MKAKKILIFGVSGSGKSTLAKVLSRKLKIKNYDMDDIFFKKRHDVRREESQCEKMLATLCKKKQWIIEGAYARWVQPAVKSADFVILLKIPFRKAFYRITKRAIKRKIGGEKNIRDSESWEDYKLLLKFAKGYNKKGYAGGHETHKQLVEKNKKKFVIIKNNKDIKRLLKDLK